MATAAVAAIFDNHAGAGLRAGAKARAAVGKAPWRAALRPRASSAVQQLEPAGRATALSSPPGRAVGPEQLTIQEVRSVTRISPEGAKPRSHAREYESDSGQAAVEGEGAVAAVTGQATAFRQDPAVDGAAAERAAADRALAELVKNCLAGDAAAWEHLARSQHRRVYGICYRFTGSAADAEDLTQETFLKMYRNLASFDPAKGGLTTWLTTLTRNLLVDNYRRSRMDRASESLDESVGGEEDGSGNSGPTRAERLADGGKTQEQHVAGLELRAQIQAALKQVSPELREAVILRDLEDMDYKEIAEVLGVPQGTVKSRISRGRAELARMLKRIEGQVM